MSGNPFHHLEAVDQVERFYDRRPEVRKALRLLRRSQNVEMTGPRGIGKTSFLRYISHPDVLQRYRLDPQRNLFVYIDCQDPLMQGEEPQVYKRMLEYIVEAARRAGIDLVRGPFDVPGTAFEEALKELSERGLRTTLLLDEFQAMARSPKLAICFFNNHRALCAANEIDVAYVLGSCVSIVDICLARETFLASPFFNIFRPIRLGLFSEQDSRHLVEDSLRRVGARFSSDLLELVVEVGGGHPFFLQMAGHYAFEQVSMAEELTEVERQAFLKAIDTEATIHFRSYWDDLDKQERYVLAALPSLWRHPGYQETIEYLRDQCLIVRRNGRYDYFSPLLEGFVRRQQANGLL